MSNFYQHQRGAIAIVGLLAVVLLQLSAAESSNAITENFCNQTLCKNHIACNPESGLQDTCPANNATQVPLQGDLQNQILQLHNKYRSQLASGDLPEYKSAAKMLQMKWDDTLAYVAGYNARSCVFGHDVCRKTQAYKMSGQNIAAISGMGGYEPDKRTVQTLVDGWWNEYVDCNMDVMAAFHTLPGPDTGHFTAMAQQKSDHVGCALVRYHGPKWFTSYLVCNYAYTNVVGEAVYAAGEPCSLCPTGTACSKQYPGLCV